MAYLASNKIDVFPSTKRGNVQVSARLMSEASMVDIVNRLIDMRYRINGLKLEKNYLAIGIDGVNEQYNRCLTAIEEFNAYL